MTAIVHPDAAGTLSSADLAQASGLRQDLVERFVPGTDTPSGRVYPADRIAVAVLVKELTDASAPAQLIDTRVREFFTHTPPPVPRPGSATPGVTRRALWMAVGATAAAAMIVGGLAGGVFRSQDNSRAASTSRTTVTAAAPAPELNPAVPAAPDPVCAEWAPIADAAHAAGSEWGSRGGDPALPASSWTPEQRTLNANMVPVLQGQVADLRRLAGEASDPFLAGLMRAQANYQELFASRLMTYTPSDQALWRAASDYAAAVRSTCKTIAPR